MAKGSSGGVVSHPIVNDINHFNPYMDTKEKVDWLKAHHSKSLTEQEAKDTIDAAENYSMSGYSKIHNGKSPKETALIDAMIEDPNAPVYSGKQYRGIHVSTSDLGGQDPKEWIENIIKGGVWKEPGVSSFSAKKSTAMGFGHFGHNHPGEISILITNHGKTTGMPFKHISECTSEDEVLHSAKQMLAGIKITGYHTNKAGNEYFIEVDDSLPLKGGKGKKK